MCEYDKNIVEYLYQTKNTESHEDSDFCYGWGQNMTNCVNCGTPIETDKKVCPYCKTPYDVSGFKAEIGEMFGEITICGKTSRVYLENVERKQLLNSEPYFDTDGILHREIPKEIRKFTLIEV